MSKQKTIRGTKPTLIQRKILCINDYNPEDYRYVKEVVKHPDSDNYKSWNRRSLNKTSEKVVCLQFVNIHSGDIIEIERRN